MLARGCVEEFKLGLCVFVCGGGNIDSYNVICFRHVLTEKRTIATMEQLNRLL